VIESVIDEKPQFWNPPQLMLDAEGKLSFDISSAGLDFVETLFRVSHLEKAQIDSGL